MLAFEMLMTKEEAVDKALRGGMVYQVNLTKKTCTFLNDLTIDDILDDEDVKIYIDYEYAAKGEGKEFFE